MSEQQQGISGLVFWMVQSCIPVLMNLSLMADSAQMDGFVMVLRISLQLLSCIAGDKIDNIHKDWYGDYDRLESHHGYIQW